MHLMRKTEQNFFVIQDYVLIICKTLDYKSEFGCYKEGVKKGVFVISPNKIIWFTKSVTNFFVYRLKKSGWWKKKKKRKKKLTISKCWWFVILVKFQVSYIGNFINWRTPLVFFRNPFISKECDQSFVLLKE